MSFNFSKSKYCGLWQCPKIAWLRKYKPEELTIDGSLEERMTNGNIVGDLAMGLFGDFVEVTAYNGDNIDLSKMIENTKAEIEKGAPVICEASFDFNGLYCAVDILKKESNQALHKQLFYNASMDILGLRGLCLKEAIDDKQLTVPENPENTTIGISLHFYN